MRTTTALPARMRQFIAKLHPPSPPTAREGQQLLNLLQASFKRQLDAQHPNPLQDSSKDNDHYDVPIARESTSSLATSSYFGSMLSHSILRSHMKDNATREFDHLIAESSLDTSRLAGLIRLRIREIQTNGNLQDGELFGDKLNAWLQTTDNTTRETFFLDAPVIKAAINMLAMEDNEPVLWKWLRTVYERQLVQADLQSMQWLNVEDSLVSGLMRMAIRRNGLGDAAQQFVQACEYRATSGRSSPGHPIPMKASAKRLASAIIHHRHQHSMSSQIFTATASHLLDWPYGPETSLPFCVVYHPASPSAQLLYAQLKNPSDAQLLIDRQAKAGAYSRKAIMTALLDASKLSLDQGKRAQASFLLDFAIDHYPDYLPPRQTEEVEPQLELTMNFAPG